MLAQKYIVELIKYAQQATNNLDKDDHEITAIDIQKALGCLDSVAHELEAAQILLREELKERRKLT